MIRLKDGAVKWWNGRDAKRKRVDGEGDKGGISELPAKCDIVDYEKLFNNSGGFWFSGPPMVGRDYNKVLGETLWYKCTAHKGWFPIPCRYTIIEEEEDQ